jgi:hypothetical protein
LSGKVLGGATIRLRQRAPASEVMVDTPATVRSFGGEGFEIVGVTPGSYLLVAEAQEEGKRLVGRAPVTVAGDSIDNLDLTLHPYSQLNGKVLGDADPSFDLSTLRVTLEPHADATPASSVPVAKDGAFSIPFVPGETYDVFLLDGPPDIYLKSARIGGFDVLVTGFKAEGGALPPMELVFGARGASLGGEVADGTTKVALGATVVLVPDPARGRVQHYHMTSTDEYGQFRFRGIAPGRYTVVSWWDEPPCEVYDLESLDACRRHGNSVDFAEGESKFLGIPVSRAGE